MKRAYIFLAVAVLIVSMGLWLIRSSYFPTGYAVKAITIAESEPSSDDLVMLNNSDFRLCCRFVEDGLTKGCWILNRYDCGYCDEFCQG